MSEDHRRHRSGLARLGRLIRVWMQRLIRNVALSQLFLVAAVVVVAFAMIVLGNWVSAYLSASISRGVAETAASSIDALIANSLEGLGPERPVNEEARARLDEVFLVGNDADSTRLLQVRIRDLAGRPIYESFGGILGGDQPGDFERAAAGEMVARVSDLPLQPVGPLAAQPITVLEIHSPVHSRASEEVFAVADLYYSAKSILQIQHEAQVQVWLLVSGAGLAVIAILYVLVARVSRTIAAQRAHLARNLVASRHLAEENLALHAASERLRAEAVVANENLLASVGSDLHDSPLQMLTLLILRLSKSAQQAKNDPAMAAGLKQAMQLANEAMEELRSISSGLVLPELADLTLEEAVALAITRHEAATGKEVRNELPPTRTEATMLVKICAYRVVQEALNNAFWHGDDSPPRVAAAIGDERVTLRISNNTAQRARRGGKKKEAADTVGLRGMRFRVEALGGRIEFDLGPTTPVTITADIPLNGATRPAPGEAAAAAAR